MIGKHSLTLRILHWMLSIMFFTLIAVGFWMAYLPADYPNKLNYYSLHKSFGLTALLLVTIRAFKKISDLQKSKVPALPEGISNSSQKLYNAVLIALYICMFGMPISGYLMFVYGGHPVMLFNIPLPSLVATEASMSGLFWQIHGICAYIFMALIALHIIGFLKHLIWDKFNLLQRII